jgi:hypothetical protein
VGPCDRARPDRETLVGQLGLVVPAGHVELRLGQSNNVVEVGAAEVGVEEVGAVEVGPLQLGPCGGGPAADITERRS